MVRIGCLDGEDICGRCLDVWKYADDVEDGDAKKEERGKTKEGKDGLDICGGGLLDT